MIKYAKIRHLNKQEMSLSFSDLRDANARRLPLFKNSNFIKSAQIHN